MRKMVLLGSNLILYSSFCWPSSPRTSMQVGIMYDFPWLLLAQVREILNYPSLERDLLAGAHCLRSVASLSLFIGIQRLIHSRFSKIKQGTPTSKVTCLLQTNQLCTFNLICIFNRLLFTHLFILVLDINMVY